MFKIENLESVGVNRNFLTKINLEPNQWENFLFAIFSCVGVTIKSVVRLCISHIISDKFDVFHKNLIFGKNSIVFLIMSNLGANFEIKSQIWKEQRTLQIKLTFGELLFVHFYKKIYRRKYFFWTKALSLNAKCWPYGVYWNVIRGNDIQHNLLLR